MKVIRSVQHCVLRIPRDKVEVTKQRRVAIDIKVKGYQEAIAPKSTLKSEFYRRGGVCL